MAFKLGSERREINSSDNTQISSPSFNSSNVPINTEPLEGTTLAEAKMDGSIVIDPKVNPKSALMKRIIKHEKQHVKDKDGRAIDYAENPFTTSAPKESKTPTEEELNKIYWGVLDEGF